MEQNFEIMDVTCRDGSYVIKFQLSTADEKHICQGIESLGYRYTEIGHGMGLGASRIKKWSALHTDEEYLRCAQENLRTIKYGVFCIPGIATLDDIKLAAEYGCSFIRIGCNVEDIKVQLEGKISGKGEMSGKNFSDIKFISGYEDSNCHNKPIYAPLSININ